MTERCLHCGCEIEPPEMQRMAGLPYHTFCAEAEMDYMDRAAQHFAQMQDPIEDMQDE